MPNSFTAGPGEMPYDRGHRHDPDDGNEICSRCERAFWMDHANDTGRLCDSCCRERDQQYQRSIRRFFGRTA